MKRGRREWILALLLGGAAVVWLGDLLSGGATPDRTPAVTAADPKRYEMRGADWMRSDDRGAPLFRVRATQLSVHASERVAIDTPRVRGLGDNEAWTLTAPLGEVPTGSRTLTLRGGVEINGSWPDGAALTGTMRALTVALDEEELRSEDPVVLQGAGRRMQGVGLRADTNGEQLRLLDQVQVQYHDAG